MSVETVAIGVARTPLGNFGGKLRDAAAYDLGAAAIQVAVRRVGVDEPAVGKVIVQTADWLCWRASADHFVVDPQT